MKVYLVSLLPLYCLDCKLGHGEHLFLECLRHCRELSPASRPKSERCGHWNALGTSSPVGFKTLTRGCSRTAFVWNCRTCRFVAEFYVKVVVSPECWLLELAVGPDLGGNGAHLVSDLSFILETILTITDLGILMKRIRDAFVMKLRLFDGLIDSRVEVEPSGAVSHRVVLCEETRGVEAVRCWRGFCRGPAETATIGSLLFLRILRVATLHGDIGTRRLEAARSNQMWAHQVLLAFTLHIFVEFAHLLLELWLGFLTGDAIACTNRRLSDVGKTPVG